MTSGFSMEENGPQEFSERMYRVMQKSYGLDSLELLEPVEVPEEEETESFQRPNLSDSMIPLVGDSILEREDAEDDDDVE